ncbi:MAG: hypothetical protein WED34_13805 [Planctomycetales bacterium]
MATRRAIRGVLGNFLGTYTSRYSDLEGYWLFGYLVADLGELRIDLLAPPAGESGSPLGVAVRSATAKFADQLQKAGLERSPIREAWLTIRKLPGPAAGSVNGVRCAGHNVNFSAGAAMEGGRRYERERVVFVAPHNAEVELRSARAAEPGAAPDRRGM